MTIDLDELERTATAATQGDWAQSDLDGSIIALDPGWAPVGDVDFNDADTKHLLAFQPRVALELVRALKASSMPQPCSGCGLAIGDVWCSNCATGAERDRLRALLREALDMAHEGKSQREWDRLAAIRKLAGL